jgi:hypothetical protein
MPPQLGGVLDTCSVSPCRSCAVDERANLNSLAAEVRQASVN